MKKNSFQFLFLIFFAIQVSAKEMSLDQKLQKLLSDEDIDPIAKSIDQNSPLYQLGEELFKEKLLSGNKNISCQTCHHPQAGSSDSLPLSIGEGGEGQNEKRILKSGQIIARHSPQVFNMKYLKPRSLFWDGRVSYDEKTQEFQTPEKGLNGKNPRLKHITEVLGSTLAAQSLFPLLSQDEMLGKSNSNEIAALSSAEERWEALLNRIKSVRKYQTLFFKTYPRLLSLDQINIGHVAKALAHFQENFFVKLDSPFDKYISGDLSAMSNKEKRGAIIFYSTGRCFMCHKGVLQTDQAFKNVAFPQIGPGKDSERNDMGRFLVTSDVNDQYKFKTPSLRNLVDTAPYGHTGSVTTLKKVVAHYTHPMRSNHHYSQDMKDLPYELKLQSRHMNDRLRRVDPTIGFRGIFINPDDQADLVQFLKTGLYSPEM